MGKWVSLETFDKLEIVPDQYFFELETFNTKWRNKMLDYEKHSLLFDFLFNVGECLFRPNAKGEIELLVLIKDIHLLSLLNAKIEVKNVYCNQNLFQFELFLYQRKEELYRYPFVFELHDDIQKYCVAALCEQQEIPLYFLKFENNQLFVSLCKEMCWPSDIRQNFRSLCSTYYVNT